ncbi:unnamed protein product [Menidia menidia]|uniref:(Atlantic silverside) hypothetical protein n=1 Tax=Menidia menidia TaxID=238744 RepID=A0A8S4BQJ0_9TELE|nr:unnamed protein product [Menidia menidia]CAG5999143.1 unnamed protein product [Menidia menidia]
MLSYRHRATNMFLDAYKRNWLETEGYSFEDKMIDDLSKALEEEEEEEEETETKPDPLHQLILHFSRTALTEKTYAGPPLSPVFPRFDSQSCHIGEEDEGGEQEGEEPSFEVRQTEMHILSGPLTPRVSFLTCACLCWTPFVLRLHDPTRVQRGGPPCGLSAGSVGSAPQEKEMEKQRLLYQQSRLHNRGAAEMVLQMISACKDKEE